jgi:hypothetical protein
MLSQGRKPTARIELHLLNEPFAVVAITKHLTGLRRGSLKNPTVHKMGPSMLGPYRIYGRIGRSRACPISLSIIRAHRRHQCLAYPAGIGEGQKRKDKHPVNRRS